MPAHFLAVHDGSFALQRCQVIGQMLEGNPQFQGLIRWKRIEVEPRDLAGDRRVEDVVLPFVDAAGDLVVVERANPGTLDLLGPVRHSAVGRVQVLVVVRPLGDVQEIGRAHV